MNIATRIFFIFFIIFSLLCAIVVSMNYLANSRKQILEAEKQLHQSYKLANQLRNTSDDLTRMARTYVITGDTIYEQYYYEILAIRNGEKPRPTNYEVSYWDFVTAKENNKSPVGDAVSLLTLMKQAGISDQELNILKQAKLRSDTLSNVEKIAFGAMKGLFVDEAGELTIHRTPDPVFAHEILHNPQYHVAKAEIMRPLREFNQLINERILNLINENKAKEKLYWTITSLLIGATIVFCLMTFFYFRIKFVKPIVSLSNITQRILQGELNQRAIVERGDEIGNLNEAFNQMVEARIQIEFELKNNEQSLRTTLNSIGDALIATDIYGNVTRMNPVAEKLTGWQIADAEGKPLNQVFHIINATTRETTHNPVNTVLGSGRVVGLANHTILIAKHGDEHQISDSAAPIRDDDGDITGVVLVFRDVTKDYAIQQSLYESEERFKGLFENAEVAMCNEDLSGVIRELDELRDRGVTNLREYLENNREAAWSLADLVKVIHVNDAMLTLFGTKKLKNFFGPVRDTFGPGAIDVFIDELCAIWDKEQVFRSEVNYITPVGKSIDVIISFQIPEKKEDFKSIPFSIMNVTDLKETENELRHSEGRFKSLFENAEVSIWNEDLTEVVAALNKLRKDGVKDLSKYLEDNEKLAWDMTALVKVIQVNKATLDLFGAKTGDSFINDINKTFGENAIKIFTDELCAIWDKKKVFRSEADFQTLDGKPINAIITFQIPETDEDFKNVPVSIIDITELKMAETARRESEERLSLHQERSPLGVISWDNNMTCIQWNPAAEEIFGYTQKEALGKHGVELLVSKKLSSEMSEVVKKLMLQTGGTHSINENVTKDGRIIICEWFNTPLIDENGHSIGAASMVQDITKHKLIEDELRKLSSAVEQSPASIVITNTKGAIEYVNPKFEHTTGYSAKEVMGKNPRFLKTGYTSNEEYTDLWNTITAGKEWRGDFHNRKKDGSLFWESASISPITAEDGTITHFLAAKEDITERKQLEDHLRRSHKMEAVGELAGGIAHDFNNLLGVIIGNLDLMKRKVEEGSKLQSLLEKAQNAALRGSSLTRRLLNFSHQAPEVGSPANVNKVIKGLEDLVGKSLTSKITLETVLADDLWMVELNTGDFEDMLINLSLNARDAMPHGGRLIVETQNKIINRSITEYEDKLEPGEYVEITISDTGIGMAKNVTAKIFDPFFTTKEKDKGTGLGLAMVYGFIQRTKGHISVYSEVGIGTTFRIYLPRSLSMAERMEHAAKVDEVIQGGTENILIVDDEEELTFIAKNILEELGYTTNCAYNSDEALQILEHNNIDLLFSDIVMAGSLNGFDLADTISKTHPEVKILLTSGFAGKMQNSDELEKWGKKMITKPYRGFELANRIRETLDDED